MFDRRETTTGTSAYDPSVLLLVSLCSVGRILHLLHHRADQTVGPVRFGWLHQVLPLLMRNIVYAACRVAPGADIFSHSRAQRSQASAHS